LYLSFAVKIICGPDKIRFIDPTNPTPSTNFYTTMKYSMIIASMATTLMAAPVAPNQFEWTPTLAGYFDVVFQYMQQAKTPGRPAATCDLSRVAMPIATTPLPFPPGLVLEHVAVGRGVQVRKQHC
jgi:hypothetical protein